MIVTKTVFLDEKDIRAAIVDYVASQCAGDGPEIKFDDIEFKLEGQGEISARAKAN